MGRGIAGSQTNEFKSVVVRRNTVKQDVYGVKFPLQETQTRRDSLSHLVSSNLIDGFLAAETVL